MTFKTKLPATIRVGAHDIRFAHLAEQDAKIEFGAFYNADMTISLAKEFSSGSVAVETAIHELVHVLLYASGLKIEVEEQMCDIIGNGLAQVIRDNPEFLKWLQVTVAK
jgi:hypothetical protein